MKSKNKAYPCEIHCLPLYDVKLLPQIEILKKEGILDSKNPELISPNKGLNYAAKCIIASKISDCFTPGSV